MFRVATRRFAADPTLYSSLQDRNQAKNKINEVMTPQVGEEKVLVRRVKYSGPDSRLLSKVTPCSCSVSLTPPRIRQIRAGGAPSPKCCNLVLREQKCVPPLLPSGNGPGFGDFFCCCFVFFPPPRGESLYEGGRFCLTPAMFAAGNESY